ncbi:MAG: hypothetical protein KJP10_09275 [Gammaproteobacteria bacterium]|nr:hypothetical protein [Gammaproteobacteria bacterium]
MYKNILFGLVGLLAALPVSAAHIQAFDDPTMYDLQSMAKVIDSSGNWGENRGKDEFPEVSDTVMDAGVERIIFNTYVMTASNNAKLTLDFGGEFVVNLDGHDLAIYTLDLLNEDLTLKEPTMLDITIGEASKQYTSSSISFGGSLEGVFATDGTLLGALGVIMIDLDEFSVAKDGLVDGFMINALTATENPLHYPTITAAGAINTTVVPLPLPIVLFGSGLALLGFVGRRRRPAS